MSLSASHKLLAFVIVALLAAGAAAAGIRASHRKTSAAPAPSLPAESPSVSESPTLAASPPATESPTPAVTPSVATPSASVNPKVSGLAHTGLDGSLLPGAIVLLVIAALGGAALVRSTR